MSVEKPDQIPVVPDNYNVDFAQICRLGGRTPPPIQDTTSKEPEENTTSADEK